MATDTWTGGSGNWFTRADWSHGIPDSTSNVVINSRGDPTVTVGFGIVDSLSVSAGILIFDDASSGSSLVTHSATNTGVIEIDENSGNGGSTLDIGGTLTNYGRVQIGPGDDSLSASSTLKAGKITNEGVIGVYGNGSIHATLDASSTFQNDGAVLFSNDTDVIGGPISGKGSINLDQRSSLQLAHGVASGQTIGFSTGINHLNLDAPSSFYGTINDFAVVGDSVTAKTFALASTLITYTQTGADSCSWTLTDNKHSATLNFTGAPYTKSDFSISPTSNGTDTVIKFV